MAVALIYLRRIGEHTHGRLRVCSWNWRRLLFTCMILASKVCDDFSFINIDFSSIFREFDLKTINMLESALLNILKFDLHVNSDAYNNVIREIDDSCRAAIIYSSCQHDVKMANDTEVVDNSSFQHSYQCGSVDEEETVHTDAEWSTGVLTQFEVLTEDEFSCGLSEKDEIFSCSPCSEISQNSLSPSSVESSWEILRRESCLPYGEDNYHFKKIHVKEICQSRRSIWKAVRVHPCNDNNC